MTEDSVIAVRGGKATSSCTYDDREAGIVESSGRLAAGDSLPQSTWVRWTSTILNRHGQLVATRLYHAIPSSGDGSAGTNYDETTYGYDAMGRQNRVTSASGTIQRTVYDTRGLALSNSIGTDETVSTGNMRVVSESEYDGGADGGDGNLTRQTAHVDASTTRVTNFSYDFRNRRTVVDGEIDFWQETVYDNLDRAIRVDRRNTNSGGNLIGRSETLFDDRGRTYRTIRYAVDPATGTVGNSLVDNSFYDAGGNLVESRPAGSRTVSISAYDGVGRPTANYVGYRESESSSSSSEDVLENLLVFRQSATEYDAAGNVLVQTVRLRWHNATGAGPLAGPAIEPKSRDSFVLAWYDGIGRRVASANYGTNDNAGAPTRPASAPTASDTVLVSLTHYDDRGEAFEIVGPDDKVDRSYADDAGRQTLSVRNYVPPGSGCYSPGEEQNVVVRRTYLAGGRLGELIAVNPNTGNQVTTYEYGVTLSGSDLASNDLLGAEVYPDSTGSSDQVSYAYNRQGQVKSMVDQRGTTHAYAYDALGRRTADSVTALGGTDGAVRRIGRTYDVRGLVDKSTSWSDAAGTTVVSEIKNAYNAFGQLTVQHQEHGGAVNVSTSPKVQYAYADGSANTIRPTSMTYPDGVALEYLYSDDAADALSRPRTLWFDGDEVCTYAYLGTSSFVQVNYPEPEVRLTSFLGSGSDLYAAFDRFGRTIEQRWQTFANPTTKLVQLKYGYDRASNRLWREDVAAAGLGVDLDELYAYDGMDRLEAFDRGDLDEEHDSIGTASTLQAWDLDAVGNWQNFFEIVGGNSLDQQRTFNTANEITDISKTVGPNWGEPVYDAAGNMTRITRRAASPDRWAATWDAWNRLVKLEESDGSGGWLTKQENAYDAQNRRTIKKTYVAGSLDETRHYYWTASWQGIEERVVVSSVQEPERQYVYGLRYIDDVVLRDRDTQVGDSGSSSDALVYDERLYAMQDANWNVVALCDDLGTVQRRYAYQPYGDALGLNASFGSGGPDLRWTRTFASYEYDRDVDLFQVRWRWYSPLLGNWVSRDPANYADGMCLYAFAWGAPTGNVDSFGMQTTSSTGIKREELKEKDVNLPTFLLETATVDFTGVDTSDAAQINAAIKRSVGLNDSVAGFDKVRYGITLSDEPNFDLAEGLRASSGFAIGYKLRCKYTEQGCDFSESLIAFRAYALEIKPSSGKSIYLGNNRAKKPVVIDIPGGIAHEFWHTDGAQVDYQDIFKKTGLDLTRKPGYKSGARDALRKFLRCVRDGKEGINSQESCNQLLTSCFGAVDALAIGREGYFHEEMAPTAGINAYYSWKDGVKK